jgi:hypothetical protein
MLQNITRGAMTVSITTFNIITLRIIRLSITTLSISTLSIMALNIDVLCGIYTRCRKEGLYAWCHHAGCRYTECRGALLGEFVAIIRFLEIPFSDAKIFLNEKNLLFS